MLWRWFPSGTMSRQWQTLTAVVLTSTWSEGWLHAYPLKFRFKDSVRVASTGRRQREDRHLRSSLEMRGGRIEESLFLLLRWFKPPLGRISRTSIEEALKKDAYRQYQWNLKPVFAISHQKKAKRKRKKAANLRFAKESRQRSTYRPSSPPSLPSSGFELSWKVIQRWMDVCMLTIMLILRKAIQIKTRRNWLYWNPAACICNYLEKIGYFVARLMCWRV